MACIAVTLPIGYMNLFAGMDVLPTNFTRYPVDDSNGGWPTGGGMAGRPAAAPTLGDPHGDP